MLESGTMTLGVNYWASHAATEMWSRWDADAVERDFRSLAEYGTTLVRVFPLWPDFQPITLLKDAGHPGGRPHEIRMIENGFEIPLPDTPAGRCGVSELMMQRFETLADLAEKHGLKLIVAIMTGHMTFRQFVPPALDGRDIFRDPIALKWEARFLSYFVSRMKRHPAIFAWESGNESNYMSHARIPEEGWVWIKYIHGIIRENDNSRPVIGVSGLTITPENDRCWLIADQAELSDYLTVHPYPMWKKAGTEEFNEIRNLFFTTAESRLVEEVSGKPCFVEETGTWRPISTDLDGMGAAVRGMLWNLWANDCRGFLWWCAFDQDSFDIAPYDWVQPGLEHGIFTADRKAHPAAESMRLFRDFLDTLPFRRLPRSKPDAICLVEDSEIANVVCILAHQAGLQLEFQAPADPLKEASVYFLPSAKGRAGLSTRRWEALLEKVRNGATLYLALDDTFLTHLAEVCGGVLTSRFESCDQMEYRFPDFRLTLPRKVCSRMKSLGAGVLAEDSEGNPVLFEHSYGKGRIYTLAFPLERIVLNTLHGFDTDAWKIYALILPKQHPISSANPKLIVTEHPFDEQTKGCVLVNCSMKAIDEELTIDPGWTIESLRSDRPDVCLTGNAIHMPANSGALLVLKRS